MTDIPNTKYITIKSNGIFLGSKPATAYQGANIEYINDIKSFFSEIQESNSEIAELHIGAFDTDGDYGKSGIPSGEIGSNIWCRAKITGKDAAPDTWIFCRRYKMVSSYMNLFVYECAELVCRNAYFQTKVISAAIMAKEPRTVSMHTR